MKNVVILLAAGKSTRCGFNKLLKEYQGSTTLEKCLNLFSSSSEIDDIWLVQPEENSPLPENPKLKGVIKGGSERFYSVQKALNHCAKFYDKNVRIIIHNAANPHLNLYDLEAGISLAENKKNVVFGYFSPNSLKIVEEGKVSEYLDRSTVFETQTPQISDLNTFKKALEFGSEDQKPLPKDEAELLSFINEEIFVYECDPSNKKITFPSDFSQNLIGLGEDSHRFNDEFEANKPFRLGGIDVSEGRLSSDGNSDGDVIFHALCNALLSARGDKTFDPIAAPICEAGNTNSAAYLEATLEHLGQPTISQVLISLEGAQPKIAPHHEIIQKNIAQKLNIDPQKVGLTYTTGENLSEVGQGLGIRSSVLVIMSS